MTLVLITLMVGLLPIIPGVVFAIKHRRSPLRLTRTLVMGMSGLNLMIALAVIGLGVMLLAAPNVAIAAGLSQEAIANPYTPIAAAISVGVGSISAGYAVSSTGAAAIGAIAEKPEVFGRALIFVGLAEGVAIYGLIIAFIILR